MNLYKHALDHFGSDHQIQKTIEELGELASALARYSQSGIDCGFVDAGLSEQCVEEIADVEIMLGQMGEHFGRDRCEEAYKHAKHNLGAITGFFSKDIYEPKDMGTTMRQLVDRELRRGLLEETVARYKAQHEQQKRKLWQAEARVEGLEKELKERPKVYVDEEFPHELKLGRHARIDEQEREIEGLKGDVRKAEGEFEKIRRQLDTMYPQEVVDTLERRIARKDAEHRKMDIRRRHALDLKVQADAEAEKQLGRKVAALYGRMVQLERGVRDFEKRMRPLTRMAEALENVRKEVAAQNMRISALKAQVGRPDKCDCRECQDD